MGKSYQALGKYYDRLIEYPYDLMLDFATAKHKSGKVLDLFCGTGIFSIMLAEKGFSVEASDLSEEMLQAGMENATKKGVKIIFRRENALDFAYTHKYDLITAVSDGINYLPEKDSNAFFSRVFDALSDGGRFVFDMSSAYKLKEILGNEIYYEDYDDLTYFWKNTYRKKDNSVKMELTFFEKKSNGLYERSDETQRQYSREIESIISLVSSIGFKTIEVADENLRKPKKNSERIFFVLEK